MIVDASRTWARPVGMRKFVLMSFFTMGLYDVYWFYWNWRRERASRDPTVRAGLLAFLSPFAAYFLFRDIRTDAGAKVTWSPVILATLYFVMVISFVIPGWWWVLTWLSFLPLVPVQQTINQMHAEAGGGEAPDEVLTPLNIFGILAGATLMALVVMVGIMVDSGKLGNFTLDLGSMLQQ